MHPHSFTALATSASVVKRAVKVALFVGTILGVINHADAVYTGTFAVKNGLQVLLTYCVPYAVATYSAVRALQEDLKKTQ